MNALKPTVAVLGRLSPMSSLDAQSLEHVAELVNQTTFSRSRTPLEFNWQGKIVYLLRGQLKLDYQDGSRRVLVGGSGKALAPISTSEVRLDKALAVSDVELAWFDAHELDMLFTWDQLVPRGKAYEGENPDDEGHAAELEEIGDTRKIISAMYASLPQEQLEKLLVCFKRRVVKAGELIVRQNDPGDYFYVIKRGRAMVTREVGGAHLKLADLKPGSVFGEESLVFGVTRNATVTMRTPGELLYLDKNEFMRYLCEPLLHRIDGAEALRRVAAGSRWLDVRFPAEYQQDGLNGAMNIPINELRDAMHGLNKQAEYIVYCQSGRRSSGGAFLLSQNGFRACMLEGGMKTLPDLEQPQA